MLGRLLRWMRGFRRHALCQQFAGQRDILQGGVLWKEIEVLEYQPEVEPLGADVPLILGGAVLGAENCSAGHGDRTAVRFSKKLRHRSSVVLPLPEAPMMDRACPFSREKLMSCSTWVAPNCFSRWDTSKIAILQPPLLEIIQPPLDAVEQNGQHTHKEQVERAAVKQRPYQAGAFHERIARERQLVKQQ